MQWQAPVINEQETQERFAAASQRVDEIRERIAQKQIQVTGVDENIRFKVIFDILEAMGWPRILMDAMVAEGLLEALEQIEINIDEKIREAQLGAQAQGQEVRTHQGLYLPGMGNLPPDPTNGQPQR